MVSPQPNRPIPASAHTEPLVWRWLSVRRSSIDLPPLKIGMVINNGYQNICKTHATFQLLETIAYFLIHKRPSSCIELLCKKTRHAFLSYSESNSDCRVLHCQAKVPTGLCASVML